MRRCADAFWLIRLIFSEEKLKAANIIKRFKNEDRECCLKEVLSYIEHEL